MSLTIEDVQKVATLARLNVAQEQLPNITQDLDNILQLVAKMDSATTQGVEPMAHPMAAEQPLRDDVVTETNQRELMQAQAPAVKSGLYIVPPVIDAD